MARLATLVALATLAALAVPAALAREPKPIWVGYRPQVFAIKASGGAQRLTGGPEAHYGATWSPDGRTVAVLSRGAIEIVALDGSVRHRFDVPVGPVGVAWAPDGHRIAYVAGQDLVVARADGGGRRVLAHRGWGNVMWSPDGATIYYVRVAPGGRTTLEALSPRGDRRRTVAEVVAGSRFVLSPDGRHVVYKRGVENPALWVVRTRDGASRELTHVKPREIVSYGWVGPDAVFGGTVGGGRHPVITSLSGGRRAIGASVGSDVFDISPDGRRIAWGADIMATGEVRSARLDGSDLRVLARFESKNSFTDVFGVAWSPTGKRLVAIPQRHSGD